MSILKESKRRLALSERYIFLYLCTDACNLNCEFLDYNNHRKVSFCRDYWLMGGETGGFDFGIVE